MGSTYTKRYTEEFKRDAIALVDSPGRRSPPSPGNSASAPSPCAAGTAEPRPTRVRAPGRADQRGARGTAAASQKEPRTAADDRDPEKATAFFVKESDR
ncbi:hypothetical protein NKH77_52225 [Streptomyces sp. M19]